MLYIIILLLDILYIYNDDLELKMILYFLNEYII